MTSSDKRSEISKMVRFMRKNGVKSLKTADIEIHLGEDPKAGVHAEAALPIERDPVTGMPEGEFIDDEEMLFWSSDLPFDRESSSYPEQ